MADSLTGETDLQAAQTARHPGTYSGLTTLLPMAQSTRRRQIHCRLTERLKIVDVRGSWRAGDVSPLIPCRPFNEIQSGD